MKKKLKKKPKARRPLYRKPKDTRKPRKHVKAAIAIPVPAMRMDLLSNDIVRDNSGLGGYSYNVGPRRPRSKRIGPTSLRLNEDDRALINKLAQKWNMGNSLLPVLRKAMEVADKYAA